MDSNLTGLVLPVMLPLVVLAAVLALAARPLARYFVNAASDHITTLLLSDKYTENLAELLPSLRRFTLLNAVETSLRAETGEVLNRPLGTPKHYPGFDNLLFVPQQMQGVMLSEDIPVDMTVVLGGRCQRPLRLEMPLMISGMGYGVGLSQPAKIALTRGANLAGTAICSGEGPALPEEQAEAERYILQIARWTWGLRTDAEVRAAHMLEVRMGQGAEVGSVRLKASDMAGRAADLAGIKSGEDLVSWAALPGIEKPADWPAFVAGLRQRAGGIPLALKIMATDRIEEDAAMAVDLGFDVLMIDGAEGGSHSVSPIKQDDFGLPSLQALLRARRFLDTDAAARQLSMSLVVGGGYFTPGQCLKALALGADAVYLGTVPLFALAHGQTAKALPWEPITNLVFYDSPDKSRLDVGKAAVSVGHVLTSMNLEMAEALRAMGKKTLSELGPDDLTAVDEVTARLTGVRQAAARDTGRTRVLPRAGRAGRRPAATYHYYSRR